MSEFDKGIEYGRLRSESSRNLFFGYGCLVGTILFAIANFVKMDVNYLYVIIVLLVVGVVSIWKGYSDRKEYRLMEAKDE